ncbi:N/A [soil metagenome]
MLLRHAYLLRRSYDRIFDSFYWIALDLMIWGITGLFLAKIAPDSHRIVYMIISGVILWNVTYRTQIDINVSLLEELWNKNLINIFVSPLSFKEWISSLVILGMIKATVTVVFGSLIAYFAYHVNMTIYGYHLITFIVLLMMSGWWIGFFISSLLLQYGTRIQTLGWSFVWLLGPFAAIYYPLNTLPVWAQQIAKVVPMSYVFEEARNLLFNGKINYQNLLISFVLNLLYIVIGIFMINRSFSKILQKGLVKVY